MNVPGLDERIIAHGKALIAESGDAAASAFVAQSARESYHAALAAIAPMRPFENFETIALAKLGFQYISKLRLSGAHGTAKLLVRWKPADGGEWVIAGAEDISAKPSPWSDIQHYTSERGGNSNV